MKSSVPYFSLIPPLTNWSEIKRFKVRTLILRSWWWLEISKGSLPILGNWSWSSSLMDFSKISLRFFKVSKLGLSYPTKSFNSESSIWKFPFVIQYLRTSKTGLEKHKFTYRFLLHRKRQPIKTSSPIIKPIPPEINQGKFEPREVIKCSLFIFGNTNSSFLYIKK